MSFNRRILQLSKQLITNRPTSINKSSYYSTRTAIPLAFERFDPTAVVEKSNTNNTSSPIIILHGLFGSKQNWRSLAKKLSFLSHRTVFTLDLRNHGESASTPGFTSYLDYANDVKNFINLHNLKQVILIGHSMGGKVAMTVALEETNNNNNNKLITDQQQQTGEKESENYIEKLIVIDISPAKGPVSDAFLTYLEAFNRINSPSVFSRKEADEILSHFEKDVGVRQFLLTNLKKVEQDLSTSSSSVPEEKKNEYKIRLPIQVLKNQIMNNQIGDFPFDSDSSSFIPFSKPSLFIKGIKSKYINKHNIPTIHHFFKISTLVQFDTGHWVHAEKPNEFLETVVNFIKQE